MLGCPVWNECGYYYIIVFLFSPLYHGPRSLCQKQSAPTEKTSPLGGAALHTSSYMNGMRSLQVRLPVPVSMLLSPAALATRKSSRQFDYRRKTRFTLSSCASTVLTAEKVYVALKMAVGAMLALRPMAACLFRPETYFIVWFGGLNPASKLENRFTAQIESDLQDILARVENGGRPIRLQPENGE